MRLSTFNSYALPPVKAGSLQVQGSYEDGFNSADEEDGRMPTMGSNPLIVQDVTIQAVHMIGRGYLTSQSLTLDEGGVDTALYDFSRYVLKAGLGTLTALPSGGTTPHAGNGGAAITSWTCDAQASTNWTVDRHPNNQQAYCEITVTYMVSSGLWTVNLSGGGTAVIPLV